MHACVRMCAHACVVGCVCAHVGVCPPVWLDAMASSMPNCRCVWHQAWAGACALRWSGLCLRLRYGFSTIMDIYRFTIVPWLA